VLNLEPTPLRATRPDVPPALERVVMHCLVKNREQRFQSVRDLVAALGQFSTARGSSPGSHPLQGPTGSYPGVGTNMLSPAERSDATLPVWGGTVNGERSRRASRRWTILALSALGVAAVGVATWALRGKVTEPRVVVTPALAPPADSSQPAPLAVEPTPHAAGENTGSAPAAAAPNPEPLDNTLVPSGGPSIEDDLARALGAPRARDRFLSPSTDTSARRPPLRPPARPRPAAPKSASPSSEDLFSEPK
jgi:serine/threonine-protein kinase